MRIKAICESKHRAEVALELGTSFDFWQNLRAHSFLINLALHCNLVFLFLGVEDLSLLVSGLAQLLLLEVSVSEMLGDFHTTVINFGGGGNDKFLVCSTQRDSIKGQRSSHKQQATAQLLQQKHPLAPVVPSEDDQNGPGSDAGPQFSHVLTEGFLAMAQQLSRHVFSRIVSRHFAKFNHSDTTILVATNWFQ